MGTQTTPDVADTPRLPLDVLIIGGGIQGLWLLRALRRRGYAVLLLERRELGGGQTGHSHWLIHLGYVYDQIDLARRLKAGQEQWQGWFEAHPLPYTTMPSHFGFRNPADAQLKTDLWDHPQLNLKSVEVPRDAWPAALQGSTVQVVLQTPEIGLDGAWMMRELSKGVEEAISRIETVTDIRVNLRSAMVEAVEVVLPQGIRLTLQPRALVLAAGAGNQALLKQATHGHSAWQALAHNAQQIRKAHMLVVRGDKAHLPPFTGVFPSYGGLFIVSRDLGSETVWLISDNRSPGMVHSASWVEYDAHWWLQQVWPALQEVAPRVFTQPARLQWGIYEAPKAEGQRQGVIPSEERIVQCGVRNLWAVWPTKLTLAPQASRALVRHIQALVPRPGHWATPPPVWRAVRVPADVAPELWTKTPPVPWDMFRQWHGI